MINKLSLEDWMKKECPEVFSAYLEAKKQWENKCYLCDLPKVSTHEGNNVCKEHQISGVRASMRWSRVYEYCAQGLNVDEANRRTKEDYPDDWLPAFLREKK